MKIRHLLVAALALAACGSNSTMQQPQLGLGLTCDLGTLPDAGNLGGVAIVTSPAPECPSQICLLPAAEKASDTGPLCTTSCRSDTDCRMGELGSASDPTDTHCETGFTCMVPMTVGPFACQKLCVCLDFLAIPAGGFQTPAVCAGAG
jgi:hypothetical protein